MPRVSCIKAKFGRYKGKPMSKIPLSHLASLAGYSKIGYIDLTLPWEQPGDFKDCCKSKKPEVYSDVMDELRRRNQCLICMKQLIPYKARNDWDTRLLHRTCYLKHNELIVKTIRRK